VMEMCIDNPREGFSNIFDTHPPVDKRVEALVKFAGGHDPGPLALAEPDPSVDALRQAEASDPPPGGPWGGGEAPQTGTPPAGPWGAEPGPNASGPGGPWGPKKN
jgi:heat shock protein HtpX